MQTIKYFVPNTTFSGKCWRMKANHKYEIIGELDDYYFVWCSTLSVVAKQFIKGGGDILTEERGDYIENGNEHERAWKKRKSYS